MRSAGESLPGRVEEGSFAAMKIPKAILFDFDGTLFDSWPAIYASLRQTFADHGLEVPDEAVGKAALADGAKLEVIVRRLHPALPEAEIPAWVTHWRAYYKSEGHLLARPFPGMVEVLARLAAAGLRLTVASNKEQRALNQALESHGLAQYLDLAGGVTLGGPTKPEAAFFNAHFSGLDAVFRREELLVVGDSEVDAVFARAIGAGFCHAAYGYGRLERCREIGVDLHLEALAELPLVLGLVEGP